MITLDDVRAKIPNEMQEIFERTHYPYNLPNLLQEAYIPEDADLREVRFFAKPASLNIRRIWKMDYRYPEEEFRIEGEKLFIVEQYHLELDYFWSGMRTVRL